MNAATLAAGARIVVAGALLIAAVSKLRSRATTREQMIELLGAAFGPIAAAVVPVLELAIAIALIVWWTPVPGVAALVLLLAFSAVLVRAAMRGVPCPCFGVNVSAPGRASRGIGRNAALVAYAVFAMASPSGANVLAAMAIAGAMAAVAAVLVKARFG